MRTARTALLALLVPTLMPAPRAAADPADPRVLVASRGSVTAGAAVTCVLGAGVATSLREVTYPVVVQAVSSPATRTTSVACWVDDVHTGEEYGRVSATFPGPAAAWTGEITVPFRAAPRFCTAVETDLAAAFHCSVP